jgi:tRNA(Ile)-lysidine synthase
MESAERHPLEEQVAQAWSAADWADVHVVAAVSAGADSVAMLRLLLALKSHSGGSGSVYVAHVNHQLRGADAAADQAWLESLCLRLGVPLEVSTVDVAALAADEGDGWEAAARQARYELLCATAERLGARFVAAAHTADDQVETVLHHILRGTGLAGLAGMPPVRPLSSTVSLVRPLIGVSRRNVLQYLADIGQDFRTDATNADARFTRNRLRHELVPLVREKFNPEIDAALLRLAQQAAEAQQVIADLAAELFSRCVEVRSHSRQQGDAEHGSRAVSVRINCRLLAGQPPMLVRELCRMTWVRTGWPLQAMGFSQWCELAQFAIGGGGPPLNLPGNVRAQRDGDVLVLSVPAPDC